MISKFLTHSWWKNTATHLLLVLLAFSIGHNIHSYFQGIEYRRALERLALEAAPSLKKDDAVPTLRALTLDSESKSIRFSEKKILCIFSKDCPACQANFETWIELGDELGRSNVLFISIDPLDQIQEYASKFDVADRTVVFADRAAQLEFKATTYPQTLLVQNGTVRASAVGILSDEKTRELRSVWSSQEKDGLGPMESGPGPD